MTFTSCFGTVFTEKSRRNSSLNLGKCFSKPFPTLPYLGKDRERFKPLLIIREVFLKRFSSLTKNVNHAPAR